MSACSTLSTSTAEKGSASNPFILTQGITFRLKNQVNKSIEDGGGPFDLTGFTGRSQMRLGPEDVSTPVAEFTVSIPTPTNGLGLLTLGATLSTSIAPGLYVFDIEYVDGGDPNNIISGTGGIKYIQVIAGVTKP